MNGLLTMNKTIAHFGKPFYGYNEIQKKDNFRSKYKTNFLCQLHYLRRSRRPVFR